MYIPYKAAYIAQSMQPSRASTDMPTFRVIQSAATEALSGAKLGATGALESYQEV